MSKIEMARKLAKQTAEQEENLEQQKIADLQEIKDAITAMMDVILMVIENQGKMANYQQKHLPEIMLIKMQIANMEKDQKINQWILMGIFVMLLMLLLALFIYLKAFFPMFP